MRLLSQPTPGESVTESPGGAVPLLASGPRAQRVGATRRKGRGEGRRACADCEGGHGGSGEGRKLRRLADLPQHWWTPVPQDKEGYPLLTHTWLMGRKVVTLLDGGAAVKAVAEELIVGCIYCARDYGLSPKDPPYPIVQLERYSESEAVAGVAKGHA
eukprot:5904722-Alexandrium_andersonii.AAC.1